MPRRATCRTPPHITRTCDTAIIRTSLQQVVSLTKSVSESSREQTDGIQQINRAVEQMNQVTQSNAAVSEEAAASSETLSAAVVCASATSRLEDFAIPVQWSFNETDMRKQWLRSR